MLSEFFAWWTARLAETVPLGWRPDAARLRDAVTVDWNGAPAPAWPGGFTLSIRRGGAVRPVRLRSDGALPASVRRGSVVLRVPPDFLLEREVALPLAASRDPEGAIRFEMDRLTPFAAEEVAWMVQPAGRDRARGRLWLRLSLVPRARIEGALASLERNGIVSSWVAASAADGALRILSLDKDASAARWRTGRGVSAVCAMTAALAILVLALPFALQGLEERRIEQQLAALRPALAELDALRAHALTAQSVQGGDVIAAERAEAFDPIGVLAALTALLPDDTFLQELSVAHRSLSLRGQSADAARLIARLAADHAIHNPEFAAPVTRMEGGRAELFAIRADWRPEP